jgi:hypothetical protein
MAFFAITFFYRGASLFEWPQPLYIQKGLPAGDARV